MKFKKGRFDGNYEMTYAGLHVKGRHKKGAMTGDWHYDYENKEYTWTFLSDYILYDFSKNGR